jgi:hypothetical protein
MTDHTYVFSNRSNALRFIIEARRNCIPADALREQGKKFSVEVRSTDSILAGLLEKFEGKEQTPPATNDGSLE